MANENIVLELVEEISEALVFLELEDVQSIASVHSLFEKLTSKLVKKEDQHKVSLAIEDLLKDLLMEDVEDIPAALTYINSCMSAFQSIYRDGIINNDVVFPELASAGDNTGLKLPNNVDESIFMEFIGRQETDLHEFESKIMDLDSGSVEEMIPELKRFIHTLKGESGLMGLSDSEAVCHKIEDIIENGFTPNLIDLLLQVKDWLLNYFSYYTGEITTKITSEKILEKINNFQPGASDAAPKTQVTKSKTQVTKPKQDVKAVESAGDTEEKEKVIKTLKEKFENSSNPLEGDLELLGDFILETSEHLENADAHLMILEGDPQNDESLNTVFRAFHTVKGVAGFLDLTMVGTLAHEAENLLDKARKGEMRFVGPVCEITFQSLDRLKFLVIALQKSMSTNVYIPYDEVVPEIIYNLRQIIAGKTEGLDLDDSDQMPVARQQFPDGDTSDVAVVKSGGQRNVKIKEFVKVDSHRLDKLVNTIGEMVIVETMVSQLIEENAIKDKDDGQISARLNQMNKITRELQEMGTSLRMVPVKPVFQKMARLVRDLSKKMKRPVNFVMVGEDTELDKTVVDMIGDPLVHLVRNSMDHGIEATFEERRALDKPDIGRIELRSFNAGGNIYIEIEDDGKGLDKDAILAKAIKQGLVKENEKISDRDLYNLIFEAGFSTAKKVTDVSGRGVGMDVVRKNIAVLRGRVEISSEKGKGSVISIVLPLTLAIIEGMIIAVGEEKYIIPTLSIITSLRPEKENLNTIMDKGEMLNLKGELIPIFRLENIFNANAAIKDPTKGLIVVVEHDGKKLGLLTDKLLGQSQIVIKSLGESMHGIDGLSGGAILPDGRVGLILDIGGIMKIALSNSKKKKAVAEN